MDTSSLEMEEMELESSQEEDAASSCISQEIELVSVNQRVSLQISNILTILNREGDKLEDKLKYLKEIDNEFMEKFGDPDFLIDWEAYNCALCFQLLKICGVATFKESDLQVFRRSLVASLCDSNIFLISATKEAFLQLPSCQEFFCNLVTVLENDNEEIGCLILKFMIKVHSQLPLTAFKKLSRFIMQLKVGYRKLLQTESYCLLVHCEECPKERTNESSPPTVSTLLCSNQMSLKLWTYVPRFLCTLLQFHKRCIKILVNIVFPQVLKFILCKDHSNLRENKQFDEGAYIEYVRIQFCAMKFAYCLGMSADLDPSELLNCYLTLLGNCPSFSQLKQFHPHTKMLQLQFRFDLWHFMDTLLSTSFINYITTSLSKLEHEELEIFISIMSAKLHDSSLSLELQTKVLCLLTNMTARYVFETEDYSKIRGVTSNLLHHLARRLKSFLMLEIAILGRKNMDQATTENARLASVHANRSRARIVTLFATPKESLQQDCENFLKEIILKVNCLIPKKHETCIFQEVVIVEAYSKFLKYAIKATSIVLEAEDQNLPKSNRVSFLTIASICGSIPHLILKKILFSNLNYWLSTMLVNPKSQSMRCFIQALLESNDNNKSVLCSILLDYCLHSLGTFTFDLNTIFTEAVKQNLQAKCQANINLLSDVIKAGPSKEQLTMFFEPFIRKCTEMMEATSLWKKLNFYSGAFLAVLNVPEETIKELDLMPISLQESLIPRLTKLYKSSKNCIFQHNILKICLLIYKMNDKDKNSAVLPLFILPTVKSLQSVTPLARQALANVSDMIVHFESEINSLILPFQKEFMEGLRNALSTDIVADTIKAIRLLIKFRHLLHNCENESESEKLSQSSIDVAFKKSEKLITCAIPMEKVLKSAWDTVLRRHTSGDFVLPHTISLVKSFLASNLAMCVQGTGIQLLKREKLTNRGLNLCHNEQARDTHKTALLIALGQVKQNAKQHCLFLKRCLVHYTLTVLKDQKLDARPELIDTDLLKVAMQCDFPPMDGFVIVDAVVEFMTSGVDEGTGPAILKMILDTSQEIVGEEWFFKFNMVLYYLRKAFQLCYQYDPSLQLVGCKMVSVILHHFLLIPGMSDVIPDVVLALLHVIGSQETVETKASVWARDSFSTLFSKFKKIDIHEKQLNVIVTTLFRQLSSNCNSIRIEVFLSLSRIDRIVKTPCSVTADLNVALAHVTDLEKIFAFMHFKTYTTEDYDDKLKEWFKSLSDIIVWDSEEDWSSSKTALFEYLFERSLPAYLLMQEGRSPVVCNWRVGLELRRVTGVALHCVSKIYNHCKDPQLSRDLVSTLFADFEEVLAQFNIVDHFYYCYLFLMFRVENLPNLKKHFQNFRKPFAELFQSATRLQVKAVLDNFKKNLCYISQGCEVGSRPAALPVVDFLLLQFKKKGQGLVPRGQQNDCYDMAILLLQRCPLVGANYFLFNQHCLVADQRFMSLFKYVILRKPKVFLDSLAGILLKEPQKFLVSNQEKNSPENWISTRALKILYYLCKHHADFNKTLSQSTELVSILRNVWNDQEFHDSCISRITREFKHFKEYKHLLFCLCSVYRESKDVELMFELLQAPFELYPEQFIFLNVVLFSDNFKNEIASTYENVFLTFLSHTDPHGMRLALYPEDIQTVSKHSKEECSENPSAPLFISNAINVKFVRGSSPEEEKNLYTEDLQVKIWQLVLMPAFKCAFSEDKDVSGNEKTCDEKVSKVYSKFVEALGSYQNMSDELMMCFVQFACLLLKYSSGLNEKYKEALDEFALSLAHREYTFPSPFRWPYNEYGYLLACSIHVHLPHQKEVEPTSIVIEVWSKLLMCWEFSEIVEQALWLVPQSFSRFKPLSIYELVKAVVKSRQEFYNDSPPTDDWEALGKTGNADRLAVDSISAFIHWCQVVKNCKNTSEINTSIAEEEDAYMEVLHAVIDVLFLLVWKNPNLFKVMEKQVMHIFHQILGFCPAIMKEFAEICMSNLEKDSDKDDSFICANLNCVLGLLRRKEIFKIVLDHCIKSLEENAGESATLKLTASQNTEIAKLSSSLMQKLRDLLHTETILQAFSDAEKLQITKFLTDPLVSGVATQPQARKSLSFPWQEVNSPGFYVSCVEFIASTLEKKFLQAGMKMSSHTLPFVKATGNTAFLEDAPSCLKLLNLYEMELQKNLLSMQTTQFFIALVQQCKLDPSLAESVWLALFPLVLEYKENDTLLLNKLLKNTTAFPKLVEKALVMFPKLSLIIKYDQPSSLMSSFAIVDLEMKLFQTKPKDLNPDSDGMLATWYSGINEQDLLHGLCHCRFGASSNALGYERDGYFGNAKKEYEAIRATASFQGLPKFQKSIVENGYKRCMDKIGKWKSKVGDTEAESKECPPAFVSYFMNKQTHSLDQMYSLLFPWNVRKDNALEKSEITATLFRLLHNIAHKLKTLPVMATDFLVQLQDAARVLEYERMHLVLKNFLDSNNAKTCNSLEESTNLADISCFDNVHATRLRLSSYLLQHETFSEKALGAYNMGLMRMAKKMLDMGDPNLCLKYVSKVKCPASSWEVVALRTLAAARQIHGTRNPAQRIEIVNVAMNNLSQCRDANETEVQINCKAYGEWLKSSYDETNMPDQKGFAKNHGMYGGHLELSCATANPKDHPNLLGTAEKAIKHLIIACKYKDTLDAQVLLAKALSLMPLDMGGRLEGVLLREGAALPPAKWLPLLPQLVGLASRRHRLATLLQGVPPQQLYNALSEFKSHANEKTLSKEFLEAVKFKEGSSKLQFTLEKIGEALLNLKNLFCDPTLGRLKAIEARICDHAYEFSVSCAALPECPESVEDLLHTPLRRCLLSEIENILLLKEHFKGYMVEDVCKLHKEVTSDKSYNVKKFLWELLLLLTNIIKKYESCLNYKINSLYNHDTFLSSPYFLHAVEVEMFGNFLSQGPSSVRALKFLPKLEIVQRHNMYTCRIHIQGSDGKHYSFLVVPSPHMSQNKRCVSQLFSFLNGTLAGSNAHLKFSIPSVTTFKDVCILRDDKQLTSLFDIFKKFRGGPIQHPVAEYYRIVGHQNSNHLKDQDLRCKNFNKIQELVPSYILKCWAEHYCNSKSDYFIVRKKLCCEIGLIAFAKYCFHLSTQSPENMHISNRTYAITSFGLEFVTKRKLKLQHSVICKKGGGLQLTPNMWQVGGPCVWHGPALFAMATAARCFLKNGDSIRAHLNILIPTGGKDDSSVTADEQLKETKEHVMHIGQLIQACGALGSYKLLHTLISDSSQVRNMSLSNPRMYPWL